LHISRNLGGDLVLGNFQLVARLEIHPESSGVLEITRKAQRRVGGDAAALSTTSAIRVTGTRKAMAVLFMLKPSGVMNSSRRISPGCTGFSFFTIKPSWQFAEKL
jgi:hypothetical protein